MICCFAIVVIFGLVLNIVSGITLALIASFGKEAYDEVRPNGSGWSWDDILADWKEAAKWLSKYATIAGVPITINNKTK